MVWKLKQGVTWHDGKPFTADDVIFNWEYAKDPATAATTAASYNEVMVEKVDQYSVMVKFAKPTPFWADAFVGTRGMIIPKHLFADYTGGKSREAPTNLKPVGTGPYMFKDFKPGDLVAGVINPNYHESNKPYFDAIEMKGGGDAVSAARAVLQSGEYDFAWNMQVEDEILARLEKGGKGKVVVSPGGNIEHIQLNTTDPWTEVDGERASLKTKHPTLQRSGGAPGDLAAGRQGFGREAHLRPHWPRHGELRQQPGALRLQDDEIRVQRRQGQRGPGEGRLEEGCRRHPREGRQEAQVRLPDLDQPAAPDCPRCPIGAHCAAFARGAPERFPVKAKKAPKPRRTGTAYWLEHDGRVLLVRRPARGLLGGMLALPGGGSACRRGTGREAGTVDHVFTHFALTMRLLCAEGAARRPTASGTRSIASTRPASPPSSPASPQEAPSGGGAA